MRDNIIIASFPQGVDSIVTEKVYRPDYGMILQIEGVELPETYTVYFSNYPDRHEAVPMVGDADGVEIPDSIISTGRTVYAWLFLHTGNADGQVVCSIIIPMVCTPEFTSDTPTPEQQNAIDTAIQALNTAAGSVETTLEYMERAEAAADAAEESESNIETYAANIEAAFQALGNVAFVVNNDTSVTMVFTEAEEE